MDRPLIQLTVAEVGDLLEQTDMKLFVELFKENGVNGDYLNRVKSKDDFLQLAGGSVAMTSIQAEILFDKVQQYKKKGRTLRNALLDLTCYGLRYGPKVAGGAFAVAAVFFLIQHAYPGATKIDVSRTEGTYIGQLLQIGCGFAAEFRNITGYGSICFDEPLALFHEAGTVVGVYNPVSPQPPNRMQMLQTADEMMETQGAMMKKQDEVQDQMHDLQAKGVKDVQLQNFADVLGDHDKVTFTSPAASMTAEEVAKAKVAHEKFVYDKKQLFDMKPVEKKSLEVTIHTSNAAAVGGGSGKICLHYLKGTCKYGDGCRNMHSAVPVAAAPATATALFLQQAQIMSTYCRSLTKSRMDAAQGYQQFKKDHPNWSVDNRKLKALCLDHPMLLTWIHDDDAPGKGWIYAAGSGPADNGNFSQSLLNDSQDDLLAVKGGAGDGPASSATGTPSHPATAPILQLAQIMSTYCRLLPNSRMDAGKGFQKFKKEHPRWRAYDYKPKALCLDHPMLLTWIHDDDAPGKGWIYVAGSEPQTAAKKGKSYSNSVVSCQSVHEKVSHNTSSLPPSFEYRRRSRFL